ncbi:MAG: hypothetical protein U1E33_02080 [Rhodospirillales bacterium]
MSVRFNVVLSDDLNRAIDKAAESRDQQRRDPAKGAAALPCRAREGRRRGLKLGLVEPVTEAADRNRRPEHDRPQQSAAAPQFSVSIEREEIAAEHRVRLFKGSVLIIKHIRFKFRSCVQAVPGAGSCGVQQPRFSKTNQRIPYHTLA